MRHVLKRVQTVPHAYLEYQVPDDPGVRNQLIIFVDSNWAHGGSMRGVYLCNVMQELGFTQKQMPFYEDNSAAL